MTKYQALIPLSVPRPGDKDKQTDLVRAGETVELSDELAAAFNRHDDRSGRQIEVLRKLGAAPAGNDVPRVLPRMVSGRLTGPTNDARPDPPGSSAIQVAEIPEATEPALGSENSAPDLDAVDIPPARGRQRAGAR